MVPKTIAIVGGGLAGLAAALEAHNQIANGKHNRDKVNIVLLDKEKNIGGNSMKASSGINSIEAKSNDTFDTFYRDTISGGGQPELVAKLVRDSPSALVWLEKAGVNLSVLSQCGGHSHARTHRCPPAPNGAPVPVGYKLVDTLRKQAQQLGIQLQTNSRVTSIIRQTQEQKEEKTSSVFTLIINGDTELQVDSLVLTTGGFGGQIQALSEYDTPTLLKEHAPQWVNRATTNGPWANGDGVRLGMSLGAATIDMDQVQIHPTGFVDPNDVKAMTKFLAPEALRAYGGILVDDQGHRFVNELTTRDELTSAILRLSSSSKEQDDQRIWLLLSSQAAQDYGEATLAFYESKHLIRKVDASNLAQAMGLDDSTALSATLHQYDIYSEQGNDPFGKTRFPCKISSSSYYWLAQVTPCVHYTMGGLKINTEAQVLSKENDVSIPGLFGAGEVTGGVHGRNRLAGNSLLECIVYGRTAGKNAAQFV